MSAARPKTILVVDPDTRVCQLLEATLRLKDFKVVATNNAIDTLGFLAGQLPELIVCESELPEMDGFEFFRRVRGTVRAAHVPFILVSARTDPREGAKALRLGVEEYMRKPFSVDELLVRMEKIFEEVKRRRNGDDRPDLEGRLERLPLVDLVYLLEQLGWSGRLTVNIPGEHFQGLALWWQGRLAHAVFGFLQGRAALLQLLLRPRGHFAFHVDERQVVPVVTIQGSAVDILDQGLQLVEERWLGRIDVSKEDAGRAFQNKLEEEHPESELEATADGGVEIEDDEGGETARSRIDIHKRSATVSQSVEMVIEDATAAADGSARLTPSPVAPDPNEPSHRIALDPALIAEMVDGGAASGDEALEGSDGVSGDEDEAARTSMIIPRDSLDNLTGSMELEGLEDSLEDPSVEEKTLEPTEAKSLEALFSALVHKLLGERYDLGVESIQISARKGKTLRSTIGDREQQAALCTFAAQAIQFAEQTEHGRYAELSASDLFLMVVELPQGWLLTLVFERPPKAKELMKELNPLILAMM